MGYIKFRILRRKVREEGRMETATISRISSDMAGRGMYDLPLIVHALSARGFNPTNVSDFILNEGVLDNENWLLG